MLNDVLWDGKHTGRVIAVSQYEIIVKSENEKWDGENTQPMPLTNEWIVRAHEVCEKNSLYIDFSHKNKLKISIIDGDRIVISYFYPMPQYVHELQHILRYFNLIEI